MPGIPGFRDPGINSLPRALRRVIKGAFITTQLNSQLIIELSTRSQREQLSPISSERCDPVEGVYSDATQLNSARRRVELS